MNRLASAIRDRLVIAVPYLWLLVFFLAPFVIVLKISFSAPAIAMPPYTPTFSLQEGISGLLTALGEFSLDNYLWLLEDPLYFNSYLSSLVIAAAPGSH